MKVKASVKKIPTCRVGKLPVHVAFSGGVKSYPRTVVLPAKPEGTRPPNLKETCACKPK